MTAFATSLSAVPRAEVKVVGLICFSHSFSHFYYLVLPPIFPLLKEEFGVSWAALGMLMAMLSIGTGVFQIPAGLLVDRYGARPVLIGGFALMAGSIAMIGLTESYFAVALWMLLAGIGNAAFHPADYAIISARVGPSRMGRAFGIHLFFGYIGWMLAPGAALLFTALFGWRTGILLLGLIGCSVCAFVLTQWSSISDQTEERPAAEAAPRPDGFGGKRGIWLLTSPAILLFLMFYTVTSLAGAGVQTFSVVALKDIHGVSLAVANIPLTAYFVAAAIGTLIGGFLADRSSRHSLLIVIVFLLAAGFVTAAGSGGVGIWGAAALLALTGLCFSIANPLRDLMVRNAAPPGTIGTVFGIIMTGFSIGGAVGPVLFGWVNDLGEPAYVFYLAGLVTLLSILTLFTAKAAKA